MNFSQNNIIIDEDSDELLNKTPVQIQNHKSQEIKIPLNEKNIEFIPSRPLRTGNYYQNYHKRNYLN
jgi:hypothetical protein